MSNRLAATTATKIKNGSERFSGIVVNTANLNKIVTCGHKHLYEDLAMICARRIQQKRGLWR